MTPSSKATSAGSDSASAGVTLSNRRQHRRHDMEPQSIPLKRGEPGPQASTALGHIVALPAGGVRIRTEQAGLRADHQIRVCLTLPAYAGICPFVDTSGEEPAPKSEWTGWMTVSRVERIGPNEFDIG